MATATISATGIVAAIAIGTTTISYTITAGCAATRTITVNGVPPISGPSALCAWGDTLSVYNSNPGGTYSSTLVTVTTLGGGYGRVTGYAPGTGSVTYTIGATGCTATKMITVNPLPSGITGNRVLCPGGTGTLSNSSAGGVWTSGTTTVATIGSTTGTALGITTGITRVTYTLPTGCRADTPVTVQPPPAAITGWGSTVIIGTSTAYACATPGGVWSSSNTLVATIGSGSGIVTGRAAGTVTITYSIPSAAGCFATRALTVTPLSGISSNSTANETVSNNTIEVYPNPNKGTFTVSGILAANEQQEVWLEVTDVHGRVVYSKSTTNYNGRVEETVQLSNIASGMYFIIIRTAAKQTTLYVVVEK
jgi:hypothetical protein